MAIPRCDAKYNWCALRERKLLVTPRGSRDTHGTHTGRTGAHGHTDHTGKPHNHLNPPTHAQNQKLNVVGFISINRETLCARVLLFERPYPFKRARQPTAMTAATHRLASELESMGIELHHPVNKFWEVYGALMGNVFPEMAECAATITPQIMEHGIVTVGGMVSLTVGEMEECII